MIAGLSQKVAASFGRFLTPGSGLKAEAEGYHSALMRNGYCVIRNGMPAELCNRANAAVETFKERHRSAIAGNLDEFGHLYRVVNLHLAIDAIADLFAEEAVGLFICDRYFGAPTALYTSLYYERGSEQDLHRDTPYFCTRPAGNYLGMWLALDDVDDGNGPLRVLPGSHRLEPIDVQAIARELFPDPLNVPSSSQDGWNRYQAEVQQQCLDQGLVAEPLHVQRGDVVIWHPELVHGGAPHLTRERPRRSLVMHVTPMGMPVYHMDVFFNPAKQVSNDAAWGYSRRKRRHFASFSDIDFGHEFSVPARDLR